MSVCNFEKNIWWWLTCRCKIFTKNLTHFFAERCSEKDARLVQGARPAGLSHCSRASEPQSGHGHTCLLWATRSVAVCHVAGRSYTPSEAGSESPADMQMVGVLLPRACGAGELNSQSLSTQVSPWTLTPVSGVSQVLTQLAAAAHRALFPPQTSLVSSSGFLRLCLWSDVSGHS